MIGQPNVKFFLAFNVPYPFDGLEQPFLNIQISTYRLSGKRANVTSISRGAAGM
jgi:hypothetical protein